MHVPPPFSLPEIDDHTLLIPQLDTNESMSAMAKAAISGEGYDNAPCTPAEKRVGMAGM
jgi:hypothetical protein